MKTARLLVSGSLWALVLALPPAQAMAAAGDGWGASWSFGPVHPTTSNHIIYTKTTLVPGRLPTWPSGTGPLFIWPGLSNPTSDLVQTTADAWGDNATACGAKTGQWCLEASVFGSFGQRSGPSVSIDPDDHITIEYRLGSDDNTWTQTVTSMKLGKVVSTLTSTSGLMLGGGFGFATEADANSYTIDTQYYLCTEIHLAAADTAFGKTGVGGIGAKMGATGTGSGIGTIKNLHTPDNGLTWLADLITLPAMNPQGTQTPAPTYDCTTSGGSTGSAGNTGMAGNSGSGGTGSGGSAGKSGNTGSGGSGGSAGSAGKGGSSGTGGATGSGGSTGKGGATGTGGTTTTGTGGATGTGGTTTTGTGGLGGTGGANQGSGGSTVAGTGGTSGTGNGGATGTGETGGSAGAEDGSSGCSCAVAARSPRGGVFGFLLVGALALGRRRRNRAQEGVAVRQR